MSFPSLSFQPSDYLWRVAPSRVPWRLSLRWRRESQRVGWLQRRQAASGCDAMLLRQRRQDVSVVLFWYLDS